MAPSEPDARAVAIQRFTVARVAVLTVGGGDVPPLLVPVTFATDGDRIWTAVDDKPKTTRLLRRLTEVERTGQAAMLVHQWNDRDWSRLWWVRADGPALVIEGPPPAALAEKYPQYRDRAPDGPTIEIGPVRWAWWSAAAMER